VLQEGHSQFVGQYWHPEHPYDWKNQSPSLRDGEGLRIYEAHVGMAQEEGKVGSFKEFEQWTLPRIAKLGYNAFAVDIYGKGVRPKDTKEAGALAGKYKSDRELLRRRVAAGRGADISGISFVILYQIRLCSAHVTAETGPAFRRFRR